MRLHGALGRASRPSFPFHQIRAGRPCHSVPPPAVNSELGCQEECPNRIVKCKTHRFPHTNPRFLRLNREYPEKKGVKVKTEDEAAVESSHENTNEETSRVT